MNRSDKTFFLFHVNDKNGYILEQAEERASYTHSKKNIASINGNM